MTRKPSSRFALLDASVASLHAALAAGQTTCVEIVRRSLARVDAFDRRGPALRAVITINPRALEAAAEQDRARRAGGPLPPLHGVPIVLKDNFDTCDLPTTSGVLAFQDMVPPRDAFVVDRLRSAGAIILAKTNMTELAYGGTSVSALGGQVLNPYDLTRTPGGSSGGTGAAVAAGYAVLGTGSDTGQSIRSPASACALVGIRPTRGLVSRRGIVPFSPTQDEVGPIARTVEDAARMLDVMAAIDPEDPITLRSAGHVSGSYLAALDRHALRGARLGLLTAMSGRETIHAPVNNVVANAVEALRRLGAEVTPVEIAELDRLTHGLSLMSLEFADALAAYLDDLGPRAPVRTLDQLVRLGSCHPTLQDGLAADAAVVGGRQSQTYRVLLARRERLRETILTVLDNGRFDALLYPHQQRLAVPLGQEQVERNGVLSNGTGLPAVCFPGGLTPASATAPVGMPVGLELLGREWSEGRLLALAYAFEQHVEARLPPASTPELPD